MIRNGEMMRQIRLRRFDAAVAQSVAVAVTAETWRSVRTMCEPVQAGWPVRKA